MRRSSERILEYPLGLTAMHPFATDNRPQYQPPDDGCHDASDGNAQCIGKLVLRKVVKC
ncbi:Uncharacterised protein [Mycobacteroides abscessus subsp. abscessus]|nr:Uncharacterised protein [Mycobacteroides abscessus subsp. abscessus]